MQLAAELQMVPANCPTDERASRRVAARRPCLNGSLHRSLRQRRQYSGHSGQVARQHRELEVLVDPFDAAIDGLTNPADSLAPTEVLFDAFAFHLADSVAGVPRGAPVDCAAAPTLIVARDMRRDVARAAIIHEIARVISLVGAHCLCVSSGHAVKQS